MESIIQVFPDEFHLATLEPILQTSLGLQPGVELQVYFQFIRLYLYADLSHNVRVDPCHLSDGSSGQLR